MATYIKGTTRSKDVDGRPSNTGSIKGEDGQLYGIWLISQVHFPHVISGPVPDGFPCLFIPRAALIADDGNHVGAAASNILIAYLEDDASPEDWDVSDLSGKKRAASRS